MKNLILKYGLISGAISVVLMGISSLWFRQTGKIEGGEFIGYTGMILSMLFVYIGVRTFRDQHRNGAISFGEAFKVGGIIALISCVCYVVGWLFVYEFVMPDFMDFYITSLVDKMKAAGKPEAEIQQSMAEMMHYKELYKNPLYRIGLTFMEPLPVALLVSLVSAAIVRRKG
ncbi:MAG: DUF4199 domain-containing protein [Saprospiraceae bacterium]|nr:DUF4199 domain-containing protein [Saprospiraceae bacterium]